jgi:hypothetical protein
MDLNHFPVRVLIDMPMIKLDVYATMRQHAVSAMSVAEPSPLTAPYCCRQWESLQVDNCKALVEARLYQLKQFEDYENFDI